MAKFIVEGGNSLNGEVQIAPAKNACLPIIASTIAFNGSFLIKNAPNISDVCDMSSIINCLGGESKNDAFGLEINTFRINEYKCEKSLCSRIRASFFTVGALLSRFKRAVLPLPGGCKIGNRPIDVHIDVLNQLGVRCDFDNDCVCFNGNNMKSGKVRFRYPSVGATVNAICASIFLKGETILINVAKEPEIVDLCNFLIKCGCKIKGQGNSEIIVQGITPPIFVSVEHTPILDRIEAGTFMCACAVCKGDIVFKYDDYATISKITEKLTKSGANCSYKGNKMRITCKKRLKATSVTANVYPAFPTDMQSIICAVCAYSSGKSTIYDKVFSERFEFVKQLEKMGAKAIFKHGGVQIYGVKRLKGGQVYATDLRAGAGLIIAGLDADGVTQIEDAQIIMRGYENIHKKLNEMGANIRLIP